MSGTSAVYVGGAQDNGSWKFSSSWSNIYGGDGGYSWVDKTDSTRSYASYVYTYIYRCTSGSCANILSQGQLDGNGDFINPYIMDPNNSKQLFTCTVSLWKTTDATISMLVGGISGVMNFRYSIMDESRYYSRYCRWGYSR